MKSLVVLLAIVLCLFGEPSFAAVTRSESPNSPIPDGECVDLASSGTGLGGISRTLSFPEAGTISDVNVEVHVQGVRNQFQIALVSSGGVTVRLAHSHGEGIPGPFNYNATFDSDAATVCSDPSMCGNSSGGVCQSAPGPTCRPDSTLDAFDGLVSPGTWTLQICDLLFDEDVGVLESWSITVNGSGQLPVELQSFSVE